MDIEQLKDLCAENFDVDSKEIQVLPYDGNLFGDRAEDFLFLIKKGGILLYVIFPHILSNKYNDTNIIGELIADIQKKHNKNHNKCLLLLEIINNHIDYASVFNANIDLHIGESIRNRGLWNPHTQIITFQAFIHDFLTKNFVEYDTYQLIQTKKIKIQDLILKNIGHFSSFSMDLSPSIICLLGNNGSGKTTILRAIALALSGVKGNQEIDLRHITLQRLLKIDAADIDQAIEGFIALDYTLNQQEPIYQNKIILSKEEDARYVNIEDAAHNEHSFQFTQNKYLFKHLFLGIPQLQTKNKPKESAFKPSRKPHVQDVLALIYDEGADYFQSLKEWLKALHGDGQTEILQFVLMVIGDIIEQPLTLVAVLHQDDQIILQIGKDKILFDLLSQGFRNVFSWVGHFMKRLAEANDFAVDFNKKPALVLVDEIDTYLHPRWQCTILDKLAEHFPNTQFIVSTHSPLVASHVEANGRKAVVYVIDKEADKPREFPYAYGSALEDIFYEWTGVGPRDTPIERNILRFFEEVDKERIENIEEAQRIYDELKKHLSPEDKVLAQMETALSIARYHLENAEK